MEYMARCPSSRFISPQIIPEHDLCIVSALISPASCDGVDADSLDWFKIQEDIFGADGLWATEILPSKLK